MRTDTIVSVSVLFAGLLVVGYALSAYLYRLKAKKFSGSDLQTKILMWVPIFIIFLAFIYGPNVAQVAIVGFLLCMIIYELSRTVLSRGTKLVAAFLTILISVGLFVSLYIARPSESSQNLLIYIGFCSVLSDVTAFFFGNFFGKHHLPKVLNDRKSWEGVTGQVAGAFVGYILLVQILPDDQISIWIALPIGIGATVGDLCNSYAKRRIGIKDWSKNLPGHGGYIDRLSSLSLSFIFVYLFYIQL